MRNYFKKVVMALLVMAMIVTFLPMEKMQVQAATTTGCVPIICYTIPTGRTNTYNLRMEDIHTQVILMVQQIAVQFLKLNQMGMCV